MYTAVTLSIKEQSTGFMHILPFYAALLGLLFFYLSIRTIGLRRRLKIGVGAKDNDEMLRAMRVHSNFAEYAPLTLLLIGFVEFQGAHPWVIHGLGALLLVGRCVHAHPILASPAARDARPSALALSIASCHKGHVLRSCTVEGEWPRRAPLSATSLASASNASAWLRSAAYPHSNPHDALPPWGTPWGTPRGYPQALRR